MKNKPKAQSAPAEKRLKFFGLGKLKPYIKTYRVLFAVLIFGSVVASVLNTITPLFQQYAIDNFIANKTVDGLITFALLYASVILLCAVVDYFGSYACCRLEMFILQKILLLSKWISIPLILMGVRI